jgi:hypothetical protein
MRIPSAIAAPDEARRILERIDMPSRPPPLGKKQAGPAELSLDESTPELPWDDDPGFAFGPSRSDGR